MNSLSARRVRWPPFQLARSGESASNAIERAIASMSPNGCRNPHLAIDHHFRNAANPKGHDGFPVEERFENAQPEALVLGTVKTRIGGQQIILHFPRAFSHDHPVAQAQFIEQRLVGRKRTARHNQEPQRTRAPRRGESAQEQVDPFERTNIGNMNDEKFVRRNAQFAPALLPGFASARDGTKKLWITSTGRSIAKVASVSPRKLSETVVIASE